MFNDDEKKQKKKKANIKHTNDTGSWMIEKYTIFFGNGHNSKNYNLKKWNANRDAHDRQQSFIAIAKR